MNKFSRLGNPSRAFGALLLVGCLNDVRAANPLWTTFPTSIRRVEATAAPAGARARPFIARTELTAAERQATMTFEVALRMRNFTELQGRIARGELIARSEMVAKYFPSEADYARTVAWVQAQGLAVTRTDDNRLAVFGRGAVNTVAQAFQVQFARVNANGVEYTSAITAPNLPADAAPPVLGIHGLQPHIRFHRLLRLPRPLDTPAATASYLPAQIATAYNASGAGLTGSGQTIAIYENAYPATSDLTAFWSAAGSNASLSNIQFVTVDAGPASPADSGSTEEATLDVEWSSSLAPSAVIRIYGSNLDDQASFDETYQQIYADLPSHPGMHQFSLSYGGGENDEDRDYLVIEAQYTATLASAGVTIVAASGDYGAYADDNSVVQPSYPATDPCVTGVGGTTLTLNSANAIVSETAWSGSGGGVSAYFARPLWQTGPGVPGGSTRLSPDVAAAADPNSGAIIILSGRESVIGGTSWSTPTWAAFCALLNQARGNSGQAPLGLLNARIYPLLGTPAFHDVTSGGNAVYKAAIGYDLCTGLGTPNIGVLLQSTLGGGSAPVVTAQLTGRVVTLGQPATFAIAAYGGPPLSYQWQREPAGAGTWGNLSDGGAYSGSATAILNVSGTTYAMNGDQFQCLVSNAAGSVTSTAATLSVNPVGVTTFAGWPQAAGSANGAGSSARFNYPGGIRIDAAGNAYVADGGNDTIREISPSGLVTTFAGSPGVAGSTDGGVATALFNGPGGVAVDSSGNVYVADNGNYTIRKIAGGQVTTFAGSPGISGHVDASGTNARFSDPQNLAVDASGNIYVADGNGETIRKITPAGAVTTLAGMANSRGITNGAALTARFNDPTGVIVDNSGNVYVADYGNSAIRLINPSGIVSTLAGGAIGSADGTGTAARFDDPAGLAVDPSGNVYVADAGNDTIREVTPAGVVTTFAGAAGVVENIDGPGPSARFATPGDVAIDGAGNLYVADTGNNTIRRIVPGTLAAPQVQTQPSSVTVPTGQAAVFAVVASGSAPLTYQWEVLPTGGSAWSNLSDGSAYSGSTGASLTVSGVTAVLSGDEYRCLIQNNAGTIVSADATLTVAGAPAVTSGSQSQSVLPGSTIALSVSASGSGLTYQWQFNGSPLPAATSSTLTLANFQAANAGAYAVTVTNSYGSTNDTVAVLTLQTARLLNLSVLTFSGAGNNALFAGFVVGGTGTKQVLLRGIGPALAGFGVAGFLANPELTFYDSVSNPISTDIGWSNSPISGDSAVAGGVVPANAAVMSGVGAFALPANSPDCALFATTVPAGAYSTAVMGADGGTGIALAEIYDADTGSPSARLTNISARAVVGTGSDVLLAGFVVGGTGTETLLLRGIGPGLSAFGLTGVLANPQLTLYNSVSGVSYTIATDIGWGNSPTLGNSPVQAVVSPASAAVMSNVGAFALQANSADSAMVVSLPPGVYSVGVSGADGGSGVALVEVYELLSDP